MTCEKCMHYEVCRQTPEEYAAANYYTYAGCAEKCECFRDKSKFIELPCNVGDTVYTICQSPYSKRRTVKADRVYKVEIWTDELRVFCDNAPSLAYGKSVFASCAEAEKALEEKTNA